VAGLFSNTGAGPSKACSWHHSTISTAAATPIDTVTPGDTSNASRARQPQLTTICIGISAANSCYCQCVLKKLTASSMLTANLVATITAIAEAAQRRSKQKKSYGSWYIQQLLLQQVPYAVPQKQQQHVRINCFAWFASHKKQSQNSQREWIRKTLVSSTQVWFLFSTVVTLAPQWSRWGGNMSPASFSGCCFP
jgi:hypothetical protein